MSVLLLLQLLLGSAAPCRARTPELPLKAPTPAERRMFSSLEERLDGVKGLLPRPVDDALASFRSSTAFTLDCEGSPVTVSVRTRLRSWRKGLPENGVYRWNWSEKRDESGGGTVVCDNEMALDTPTLTAAEKSGRDDRKKAALVLFYHELLHGQLLIDAIRGDDEWKALLCLTDRTPEEEVRLLAPSDLDEHRVIPSLEEGLRSALSTPTAESPSSGGFAGPAEAE